MVWLHVVYNKIIRLGAIHVFEQVFALAYFDGINQSSAF